ncbi:uncharacterized protein MELLADRAFT_124510 [Melampsora larici-populina 98AG31]|uniref:Secreted protein n=1 Tax=Melampsora larici-populina (strain 98AG31 / pathotype 3-4-7) TaxID=747676 RepID=F4S456_MELLP|nr:uncharacterized protein MELLADRAFT_124510 [Melampsora larici-populina 98AG31]EGG00525.1 secreted protein [Melampsora larici-populina 98AG31]
MNLSIITTILVIFVSVNQSFGAMINNIKNEKEIMSVQDELAKPIDDTILNAMEKKCHWCDNSTGTCLCGPPPWP